MNVRELIQKLGRLNPEAEVVSPFGEHWDIDPIECVGYDPENPDRVVLDDRDDRWQCKCPQPYREPSKCEMVLQRAMKDMMRVYIQAAVQNLGRLYDDKGLPIDGPMRIRMPEKP